MRIDGMIKDVCLVIAGQSPKGTSYNENGIGLEFHQGKKSFGHNVIEHSNVWTTDITKIAEDGDILMSVRAPVGPTNMTDRKICIGRGLAAIRCQGKVLPQYVLYSLRNIESKIVGNDGAVFNSINKKQIEELPIPILSLSEQQEIVDYLDAAFAKIEAMKANAEKALSEAKALFQASLKEMLEPKEGWEYKTIGELCDKKNGLWKGKNSPFVNVGVIRNANFTKDFNLSFDNIEYLDVEEKQYKTRKLEKGDLIVEKSGGSEKQPVGRTVLFNKEDGDYSFSNFTSVIRIKNKNLILPEYLYNYILHVYLRGDMKAMQKATTGIHNIEFDKYLAIQIPVLPLSEQETIVDTLDAIKAKVDRLQENYDKIAKECDALKQAILKEVFE